MSAGMDDVIAPAQKGPGPPGRRKSPCVSEDEDRLRSMARGDPEVRFLTRLADLCVGTEPSDLRH